MVDDLFTYEEWDLYDSTIMYMNCVLITDVGSHKSGESFEAIKVDFESGSMKLISKEGDVVDTYSVILKL